MRSPAQREQGGRSSEIRAGQCCTGQVCHGENRAAKGHTGKVCVGKDRTGQVCPGQARSGQVRVVQCRPGQPPVAASTGRLKASGGNGLPPAHLPSVRVPVARRPVLPDAI
jgi:hypothetical protein